MGLSIITTPQELWKFGSHERAARRSPLYLSVECVSNAGVPTYSTMRNMGATSGYEVTSGKTLLLTRILFRSGVAAQAFAFGYSDSDRGFNNLVDGANPVKLDQHTVLGRGLWSEALANVLYDYNVYYEIPAGKFPRIAVDGGAGIFVWVSFFAHEE